MAANSPNSPNSPNLTAEQRMMILKTRALVGGVLYHEWLNDPNEDPDAFIARKCANMKHKITEGLLPMPPDMTLEAFVDFSATEMKQCVLIFIDLAEMAEKVMRENLALQN